MSGYKKDRAYCTRIDCADFTTCEMALTDDIKRQAVQWWGGYDAPIATCSLTMCFAEKSDER